MADTFKGIITADGKKRQLPYGAVLETPVSDTTLSKEGGFADSKAVGDKFAKIDSETASLKEDLSKKTILLNWIDKNDTVVSTLPQARQEYLSNMFDVSVKTYTDNNEFYISYILINADGTVTVKYGGTFADGRDGSYSVTLPQSETITTFTDVRAFFEVSFTYTTNGYPTSKFTVVPDGSKIYIQNINYVKNNFTQNHGTIDSRIVRNVIVDGCVESIVIDRIQNMDILSSGSNYYYYAVFTLTLKGGETQTITISDSNALKTGVFCNELSTHAKVYIDCDMLTYYAIRLVGLNVVLNFVECLSENIAQKDCPKHLNRNLTDYSFVSIFNERINVTSTKGEVLTSTTHTFEANPKSYHLVTDGETEMNFYFRAKSIKGLQDIVIPLYVENASICPRVISYTYLDDSGYRAISRALDLVNGWNYIRVPVYDWYKDYKAYWNTTSIVTIKAMATDKTSIYVGDIIFVYPKKAKVIMIDDHAYKNFKDVAYPMFKNIGVPITWGAKIGLLGESIEYASRILTQEEFDELSLDEYSEINFHSYYGNATSGMTKEKLSSDVLGALRWLKKNGYDTKVIYRSAWVQNEAQYGKEVSEKFLELGATYNSQRKMNAFPFTDKLNIPRYELHGMSNDSFDALFEQLNDTHCTLVCYTHDISDEVPSDGARIHMNNSELNYFISKLTNAINEGWLEGTTINQLYNRYSYEVDLLT